MRGAGYLSLKVSAAILLASPAVPVLNFSLVAPVLSCRLAETGLPPSPRGTQSQIWTGATGRFFRYLRQGLHYPGRAIVVKPETIGRNESITETL